MDLLNIMVLLSIKNRASPAQDPWPPKPKSSKSGPGPLANQAGPAQDPWPPKPKPSRSGPGPLVPQAKPTQILGPGA